MLFRVSKVTGPAPKEYLFPEQNFHIFRMIFLSHGTRVHHNRTVCIIFMYDPGRYTTDEGQMKPLFLEHNYQIICPIFICCTSIHHIKTMCPYNTQIRMSNNKVTDQCRMESRFQFSRHNPHPIITISISLDARGYHYKMGLVARKPVFGVSDMASLKPFSSATETS